MRTLGICVGATSLQYVETCIEGELATVVAKGRRVHEGRPWEVLQQLLADVDAATMDRVALTGRAPRRRVAMASISEPEAVEWALRGQYGSGPFPDIVVSAGGETRLLYRVGKHGEILSVASGNKCASGTGEFFLQQIRRMGLSLEEAMALAQEGTPQRVAGRCSVFCKSDCTHALNKGAAKADIIAGLCLMMAEKIRDLASSLPCEHMLVVGGGAMNAAMVRFLRQWFPRVEVVELSAVFEAYGAALWAGNNPEAARPVEVLARPVIHTVRSFAVHRPLAEAVGLVDFRQAQRAVASAGDRCVVGLDVGSTTTKAVVMRINDAAVVAGTYQRTNGDPVGASRACYAELVRQLKGCGAVIEALAVTGSGRQIAALHALSTMVVNEIRAHATAAAFYDPEVDTILEIGGQDAKYTYLASGVPCDYAMNEACSAGTGSFLEEAAGETLGVPVEQIATLAMLGEAPPDFRDECAAFISSDIKLAVQEGIGRNDILAGLVYSVCLNYLNRVKGNRRIGRRVFMQGGVCYNRAVPVAMAACLKQRIVVPPEPGLMGAFGAALEARRRLEEGESPTRIDLHELAGRHVRAAGEFTCGGGVERCDRRCRIRRYEVCGRIFAFGGACDRYYNIRLGRTVESAGLDFVVRREKLLFTDYAPENRHTNDKTVGLSRSFMMQSLYPLFGTFFAELGFKVVLADDIRQEDMARARASFCLPALVSHASFAALLRMQPDYIFIPHITQIPISHVPTFSRLCVFVQSEPYYLRATFRDELESSVSSVVSPVVGLENGYEQGEEAMVQAALQMGVTATESRRAWRRACERQRAFERDLRRLGDEALARLKDEPERLGVVIFGRSYNALSSDINMGVPHKIASRGHVVIPLDALPSEKYPVEKSMFWASGQRIMKAAQFVRDHHQLFGVYITNFSCGPDSFLLGYFRETMDDKPSLTLELDQHTANAGIDTRIEAALEIFESWRRRNSSRAMRVSSHYRPAYIDSDGRSVVDNHGRRRLLTDRDVEVVLPPMGRYSAPALAAVLRGLGINARVLPEADRDTLLAARRYATCKECLPYLVTTGSFIRYLDQPRPESLVTLLFIPTGGGPCRLGQYREALRRTIDRRQDPNVAVLTVTDENGYAGLGTRALLKAWQAIVCADVFEDIRNMLVVTAANPESALRELDSVWNECLRLFEGRLSMRLSTLLSVTSARLARIPLRCSPAEVPVVALIGEYYVRKDIFSRRNLVEYLQNEGFMVRVAPAMEYLCYSNYNMIRGLQERQTPKVQIYARLRAKAQEWWERRIKLLLARSGLYRFEMTDVARTIEGVRHLIDERMRGEAILTVGSALREIGEQACGVIAIGPFGCMPSRVAEAILRGEMTPRGLARMSGGENYAATLTDMAELPFLSIETDGNPFPQSVEASLEAFVLQARRLHERLHRYRKHTSAFTPRVQVSEASSTLR